MLAGPVLIERGIAEKDFATKTPKNLSCQAPNLSPSNDTNDLSEQVESYQPNQREVIIPHPIVGAMNLAIEGLEKGHGMLCNRMWRVGGNTGDRDTTILGRRQIDIIEARTSQRDMAHGPCREGFEASTVEVVVYKDANGISPFREGHRAGLEMALEVDKLEAFGSFCQILTVIALGIEDGNFHNLSIAGRRAWRKEFSQKVWLSEIRG